MTVLPRALRRPLFSFFFHLLSRLETASFRLFETQTLPRNDSAKLSDGLAKPGLNSGWSSADYERMVAKSPGSV
jgi:hypothetical protein